MIKTKAFFELGHLAGQGHRVGSAAVEDLDRHRTAVRSAEQTVDDLQFAALAVTVVAVLGQRAAAAFHVARRDVVEHQGAAGQVVFGKRRLDRRLADGKPVEGDVELVLIDRAEAELLAETRAGRVRRQRAGGGKLGAGIEQTADDEGQDKIATAVAVRAEQTVETDLARRSEGGSDVPMRQRADDGDRLLVTGDDGATFEQHLEAGDAVRRPVGKVEQGTLFGPCRPRGSSRAAGWPAASGDWEPIRYTWEHDNREDRTDKLKIPYYMATIRDLANQKLAISIVSLHGKQEVPPRRRPSGVAYYNFSELNHPGHKTDWRLRPIL